MKKIIFFLLLLNTSVGNHLIAETFNFIGGGGNLFYTNTLNWENGLYPGDETKPYDNINILADCLINVRLDNYAFINIYDTVRYQEDIDNYSPGSIRIRDGGLLGNFFSGDADIDNQGNFYIDAGGMCTVSFLFANFGYLQVDGSFSFVSIYNINGTIRFNSPLTIDVGDFISNFGQIRIADSITNNGNISDSQKFNQIIIQSTGTLINNGTLRIESHLTNSGTLTNNGEIENNGGTFLNFGAFVNTSGSIFNNNELSRFDSRIGSTFSVDPNSEFIQAAYSHLIIR